MYSDAQEVRSLREGVSLKESENEIALFVRSMGIFSLNVKVWMKVVYITVVVHGEVVVKA